MEPEGRPSSEALDVHKQTRSHGSWAPNVEPAKGCRDGTLELGKLTRFPPHRRRAKAI